MANFEIPEKPEYSEEIRKFEEEDPGHADLFNAVVETLLNNEVFLKKLADSLAKSISGLNTLTKYTTVQTPNPSMGAQIVQKENTELDMETGLPFPFPIQEVVAGHELALRQLNTESQNIPALNGLNIKMKVCAGTAYAQFSSREAIIALEENFSMGMPVINFMSSAALLANSHVRNNTLVLYTYPDYANAQIYVKYIVIGY